MGQANKRGNFEQRQLAAYDAIDGATTLVEARKANLEALTKAEADSEAYMKTAVSQFITRHWRETNLAARLPAAAFGAIDPALLVVAQGDFASSQLAVLLA